MTSGRPSLRTDRDAATGAPGELRFQVMAPDLMIGQFSECTGLEMSYDVEEYEEGGHREGRHRLRGHLHYPNLVMSRGITREDALLAWFRAAVDASNRPTVTIAMVDRGGRFIRHWAFAEAWPVAWRGPNLSADSTHAAWETLEIAHAGLVPATLDSAGVATQLPSTVRGQERAHLEIEGTGTVACWFNPREYEISYERSSGANSSRRERDVTGAAARTLNVELLFDDSNAGGAGVGEVCEQLFEAMHPSVGVAGEELRQPVVTFAWGDAVRFRGVAGRMSARYTHFAIDGTPVRAWVRLELIEGIGAGRGRVDARDRPAGSPGQARTHTLRLGDTLHGISHTAYGTPAYWRLIAEGNGIEDPLRLPPLGTALQLPVPTPDDTVRWNRDEADALVSPGAGMAFPLRVDARGRLALAEGDATIRDAIEFILTTEPGTRAARPDFGCDLMQFVHEPVEGRVVAGVQAEIRDALRRWEPRIDVHSVRCHTDDRRDDLLTVDISYKVRATGEMGHMTHAVREEDA